MKSNKIFTFDIQKSFAVKSSTHRHHRNFHCRQEAGGSGVRLSSGNCFNLNLNNLLMSMWVSRLHPAVALSCEAINKCQFTGCTGASHVWRMSCWTKARGHELLLLFLLPSFWQRLMLVSNFAADLCSALVVPCFRWRSPGVSSLCWIFWASGLEVSSWSLTTCLPPPWRDLCPVIHNNNNNAQHFVVLLWAPAAQCGLKPAVWMKMSSSVSSSLLRQVQPSLDLCSQLDLLTKRLHSFIQSLLRTQRLVSSSAKKRQTQGFPLGLWVQRTTSSS